MDDDLTRHTDDDALLKDPRIEALEAARQSNGQTEPPLQRVERVETVQTVRPVPVHDDPHIYEEPYSIPAGDTYYEPAPVRGQAPRAGLEGWIIAIVFGLIYGIVGYFVITDGHVVSFDAMHRLNEAYMTWWNSPPKLAAITLEQPPLGALAFLPFALIKPLATSLVAMPVLTAIAAGMLMALLNSILRRCEMPAVFRFAMIIVFGLNPMVVYYAGNGEPVVLGMVLAAISLLSIISWYITDETRGLVGAGLAMGGALFIDYQYGVWAIGLALAVLIIASGKGDGEDRLRSSLIVFITPFVYGLLVWTLLNWVILGDPIDWITSNPHMISVNSTDTFRNVTASPLDALGDLFKVVLGVAPLGLVAIIMLVFSGIFSGSRLAWGLVIVCIAAIAAPVARVLFADQADLMTLSIGLPLAVLAFAAMAAVYAAEENWRAIVGAVMFIGLLAALPLGWNAMKDYDYQNQAQAFTRYIDTRDSQEGTSSLGGYTVGIDPERTMASYIKTQIPQKSDSILVDENLSYGPMLLTGRPVLFVDRADEGVGAWEQVRDNPYGVVDYMLVGIGRSADALAKRYPKMLAGGESGLTPIFRNERYVLIKVAPEAPVISTTPGGTSTAPRPVEPSSPPSTDSDASSSFDTTTPSDTTTDSSSSSSSSSSSGSSGSSGQTTAPSLEGE